MERVRSGLRVPYDLNAWLIQEAEKQGVAKNALVLQILWEWEERHGKPPRGPAPRRRRGPPRYLAARQAEKTKYFRQTLVKLPPLW